MQHDLRTLIPLSPDLGNSEIGVLLDAVDAVTEAAYAAGDVEACGCPAGSQSAHVSPGRPVAARMPSLRATRLQGSIAAAAEGAA